jgi:hypothetical protein
MQLAKFLFHAVSGHNAADGSDEPGGDGSLFYANQFVLDDFDGQRGSDWIQSREMPGSGMHEFCSDWHSHNHHV